MGAGIRQRDDACRMLQERRHALVEGVEEPADEPSLQILFEAEIEEDVERVLPPLASNVGDVPVRRMGRVELAVKAPGDAQVRPWLVLLGSA